MEDSISALSKSFLWQMQRAEIYCISTGHLSGFAGYFKERKQNSRLKIFNMSGFGLICCGTIRVCPCVGDSSGILWSNECIAFYVSISEQFHLVTFVIISFGFNFALVTNYEYLLEIDRYGQRESHLTLKIDKLPFRNNASA